MRKRLDTLGYAVAALLVGLPLLELATTAWPWAPGDVHWRYDTLTLLSKLLLIPVAGYALAVAVALAAAHGYTGKVLGAVGTTSALVVGGLTLLVLPDILAIRAALPPDAVTLFTLAAVKAVLTAAATAVAMGWAGSLAWRESMWGPSWTGRPQGALPLIVWAAEPPAA
jgi:hypothetical protein